MSLTADSFRNLVAGLGTDRDKAAGGTFVYQPIDATQVSALYRGSWLGRKIVDIIPDDMTREWRRIDGEGADAIGDAERAFGLRAKVADALRWARLYGGAAIILGYGDLDPSKPAPRGAELRYIHVLPRHKINVTDMDRDPLSDHFGEATQYTLASGSNTGVAIHPSRVIPIIGNRRPPDVDEADPWGDSIFDVLAEPIIRSATASGAMASLLLEAKIDVITISGLASHLETPEGTDRLKARFALAALMKGINGTLLLGEGETFDPKTISFTGVPEVHARFLQEVSGAADIPLTRLLGQSPAGLNSTGESDLRNYYDGIRSKQMIDLKPILDRIDAAIFTGRRMSYVFPSLWQMTEKDKAEVFDKTASAVKKIAETGVVDDAALGAALARKLDEDGSLPGLEVDGGGSQGGDAPF